MVGRALQSLHWWLRPLSFVVHPPYTLALFALALYLLTSGAYLDNPDARSMYSVTRGIALRGSITIPQGDRLETLFEKVGRGGEVYSKYGLTQPLLQLPLFLLGYWGAPSHERAVTATMVSLLQALVTASTLPVLWHLGQLLFASKRVALALALIYATATMAWLYATLTYTEPLLTLVLLLVCWLLLCSERGVTRAWVALSLAGALTGLAILTKYPAIIYVPGLLWYTWQLSQENRRVWFAFLTPLALGMLALAGYNYWRYESILFTGYHMQELTRLPRPPWYGVYTLLFSPGKSIFVYAPPLLLALAAFPRFVRRSGAFGRCVVVLLCSALVFYTVTRPWAGDWSPGPRYYLPVLPLALLPLGCVLERWSVLSARRQVAITSVIAVGVLVQLVAVSVNYTDTLVLLQTITGERYAWGFWFFDPDYVPILWQGRLLLSACTRAVTGDSLDPVFRQISSVYYPGEPIDQLNWWVAHLSKETHMWQLGAIGLGLLVGLLCYHLACQLLDDQTHAGESAAQSQEHGHAIS